MKQLPPLNDGILFALARVVDDGQQEVKREPSHSDIAFCIAKWKLGAGDPNTQGQTVGKAKRVRGVLNWAIECDFEGGRGFVDQLTALVRSSGGFREGSPNYVGEDPISGLREALASEGFVLTSDGELRPQVLDTLSGAELTKALEAYVRRAQKGAGDAALLAGTSKDLVEATAAHVLLELQNNSNPPHNFPTLLGQAFIALGLKTSAHKAESGETPQHRLQRALYDAACAINTLRNKQGTGHGRPWLPSVTERGASCRASNGHDRRVDADDFEAKEVSHMFAKYTPTEAAFLLMHEPLDSVHENERIGHISMLHTRSVRQSLAAFPVVMVCTLCPPTR
jgi:abortive infection Abi-like protein